MLHGLDGWLERWTSFGVDFSTCSNPAGHPRHECQCQHVSYLQIIFFQATNFKIIYSFLCTLCSHCLVHCLIDFWQIICIFVFFYNRTKLFARYMFEGGTNFGYMNGEFLHWLLQIWVLVDYFDLGYSKSDLCLPVKKYLNFFFYKLLDSLEAGRWWQKNTWIINLPSTFLFIHISTLNLKCNSGMSSDVSITYLHRSILVGADPTYTIVITSYDYDSPLGHSRKLATSRTSTWPFDRWCLRLLNFLVYLIG